MKKLFIKTYGCQMNVYDSARMAELLAGIGYVQTDEAEGADMVILNTCHIREKATEKIYSELGRLKRMKDRKAETGEAMLIAVAGCVAQAEGKEILARQQAVDLVVGPQSYHRLPEMIARATRGAGHVLETDFPADEKFDALPGERANDGPAAFLTVQEGCDKFCTFCVVPYTRGSEYSRPVAQIVSEAEQLVARGVREITLLGQNVNAYRGEGVGGESWSLARLLYRLADIAGLARLRYTTSHPRDMSEDLIAAHGDLEQLMPYLHLPVQSGSDKMLSAMNRRHTAADFRRIVDKLRAARPDIALSSDFIVGHPGETDADFAATMALVRETEFALAYSFKYSPRPGTPAAGAPAQIPEAEKDRRLLELQALLRAQQDAFNRGCVGLTADVLITGPGRHPGQMAGRSPWLQPVHLNGPASLAGQVVPVHLRAAHPNSLSGVLAEERACA